MLGLTQYYHGAEYRFLICETELKDALGMERFIAIDTDNGDYVDIGFPIGGSNSSATQITPLKDDSSIFQFLASPGDGPDLEDPMLVDIMEYHCEIATDIGLAEEWLKIHHIDIDSLHWVYPDFERIDNYIKALIQSGETKIDANNPYYGYSSELRLSELMNLVKTLDNREDIER